MKLKRSLTWMAGAMGLLIPVVAAHAQTNVDVMVLFDGTARTWLTTSDNSGRWQTNTNVLQTPSLDLAVSNGISFLAFANLKIAELNLAMINSGITNVNYRLVHFGVINTRPFALVDGVPDLESLPFSPDDPVAPASIGINLTNIVNDWKYPTPTFEPPVIPDPPYDAKLATRAKINSWRETFGADLMAVMMNGIDINGQPGLSDLLTSGMTSGDAGMATSISLMPYTELDDTFSHSIGQNMGCGNSKFQWIGGGWTPYTYSWPPAWFPGPGVYSYAAGWYLQGTNGQNYRTVCATDTDDAGYHYQLTNPQMFSTPNKRYMGIPIGDTNDGDNVRCITNMAPVISAYKNPPAHIPPSVEICYPAYGQTINNLSDTFTVRAEVLDPNPGGTITNVEFHNLGQNPYGPPINFVSVTNSLPNDPNSFVCTDVPALDITNWLYCVAWDDQGNSWISAYTYVVLANGFAPVVQMIYNPPVNSMQFTTDVGPGWSQHGWTVTNLTAIATPADGWTISDVIFFRDGDPQPLGVAVNTNATPGAFTATIQWRCTNPPPAPGFVVNYITAMALDNHNPPFWSSQCNTNVVVLAPDIPPFVEIVSPTNGTLQWTNTINIVTDSHSYDIDGIITQMTYFVDGNPVAVYTQQVDSFMWTALGQATYTLTVQVWDDQGDTRMSVPVQDTIGPDQPPIAIITSPTNNAVLPGSGIPITVFASSLDGNMEYVDFLVNGTNVAVVTNFPYWITWMSPAAGTYTLTAVAVDDAGTPGTSTPVIVTSSSIPSPTVVITSPTNNALISSRASPLQVSCVATAGFGQVTSVVFYVNGQLAGTTNGSSPYSISIPNPGLGTNVLTVAALDDSGNVTFASTTWMVIKMPDLTIAELILDPVVPQTGTVFTAVVVITNIGVAVATNFHVSIWANQPTVPIDDTGEDGGIDIPSLGIGESLTLIDTDLDAGTSTVSRVLRVFVDSESTVTEENELNNQSTRAYTPAGTPVHNRIDVMLLYDRTAQTWLKTHNGNSFLANANLALASVNQTMSNSTVDVNYRLVHFGLIDTNYDGVLTNMLFAVAEGPAEAPLADTIDSWRSACGADLVAVLVNGAVAESNLDATGFYPGSTNGNAGAAFSVSLISHTEDNYALVSGLAYNMGCGKSKFQLNEPGPGTFPYAAAWYFQANGVNYRTLLADEDDGYGFHYQLVQPAVFSSPNLRYKGVPMGDVNDGDDVRCITNMIPIVEKYRFEPPNIPPSIEIISPSEGDTFKKPKVLPTISVSAETFEPDGVITTVVFYANDLPLATNAIGLINNPNVFSNNIPNLTGGSNFLYAVAWNDGGNCWTSTVTSIYVASNMPPAVTLASPADGTYMHGWMVTNISATATDSDGTVTAVVFHASSIVTNDYVIGTISHAPYTIASWICPWSYVNVSNITVKIWAEAWDDEGASTKSAVSDIIIGPDLPPFVEIISPITGTTQWRTNVTIRTASNTYDIDDTITQVAFYANNILIGRSTTSPYSLAWMAPSNGVYSLTAVAQASDQQSHTSRPSVLTVGPDLPPAVSITSPTNGAVLAGRRITMVANVFSAVLNNIDHVQFLVNSNFVGSVEYYPYSYTWLSPSSGVYSVSAIVVDQFGLSATSTAINVTTGTNLTPTISIASPTNNAVIPLLTSTIALQATVTDPKLMTTSVLFYVNGLLVGSKASTGTKTDTINMSNLGAGTNELTVEALVKAGDPQFAVDKWFVYDTRPDFQVVSIALNPTIPYVGGTFSAVVTVTNAGYTSGNAGTLSIWTNQPVGLVIGYGATKSVAVGTLAAHTGKAITFSGISAGNVDSLGRTFRAFVNSTLSSPETLVNNNQATLVYNVVSKPDLIVSSVTLSPATPARGGVFTATVAVKNQGRTNSANCNIAAWANQPAVPTDDIGKDIEFPLGTLNVNQTVTNVFPNLSVSTGTVKRTFRVFVDCGNVLDEVSKANNQQTVVYTPKSCPDFTITAVNFSPTNPIVNSNFTAYVTVRNKGYVSGSGGYLDVWANNTNQLVASPANQGDKYVAVGTIAVNTNKTYTLTGLSAGGTTNQRTFQAYVDSRGTVEETNENNNTFTVPYTPQP